MNRQAMTYERFNELHGTLIKPPRPEVEFEFEDIPELTDELTMTVREALDELFHSDESVIVHELLMPEAAL